MNTTESILDKREFVRQVIGPTTWGKRLANLIIDTIISSIVIVVIMFVFTLLWALTVDEKIVEQLGNMNGLVDHILTFLLRIAFYYIPLEYFTGKTVGKMLTQTKVVTEDGEKPDFGSVLYRSFTRIIPLEFISFFKENPIGWHDQAGGTMVVDDIPLYNLDQTADGFYEEEEKY